MTTLTPRERRPQKIAILPGDGIGIDVTREAVKVLEAAASHWSLPLELEPFSGIRGEGCGATELVGVGIRTLFQGGDQGIEHQPAAAFNQLCVVDCRRP